MTHHVAGSSICGEVSARVHDLPLCNLVPWCTPAATDQLGFVGSGESGHSAYSNTLSSPVSVNRLTGDEGCGTA